MATSPSERPDQVQIALLRFLFDNVLAVVAPRAALIAETCSAS
jgi:hypothetical protein